MAKTFLDIKNQIRTYLDESSAFDWTNPEVEREANAGYHEIITSVMETYEDFYLTTTQINTITDQQEYTSVESVPTDIFKIRRVEINYDVANSNAQSSKARSETMDHILNRLSDTTTGIYSEGQPVYYFQGFGSSTVLGFLPIPNNTDINAIKIWYIQEQSDMTSDTDAVNIPYADRYYSMAAKYAASVLLRKGQQEEASADRLLREFDSDMERMKQQMEDRIADNTKSIVVTDAENTNFSFFNQI